MLGHAKSGALLVAWGLHCPPGTDGRSMDTAPDPDHKVRFYLFCPFKFCYVERIPLQLCEIFQLVQANKSLQ